MEGRVIRALAGFYTVQCREGPVECRARGLLRREKLSPCVGDMARVEPDGAGAGTLVEVLPRKNQLFRPPLANLDQLVLVASVVEPAPSLLVLDKMITIAEYKGIEPVVVFTKADLAPTAALEEIYQKAGLAVCAVSSRTGQGTDALRALLDGKLSAFTGNSGVGKSSLLNCLDPRLGLATAGISDKLGRGRHTTRHVELYQLPSGGWVADTPGFSEVELLRFATIYKDQLQHCFREFAPYRGRCRYADCAHLQEPGCAVRAAVAAGEIAPSRHESYLRIYEEVRSLKEWEHKEEGGTMR